MPFLEGKALFHILFSPVLLKYFREVPYNFSFNLKFSAFQTTIPLRNLIFITIHQQLLML
jgi:hypothetical protein